MPVALERLSLPQDISQPECIDKVLLGDVTRTFGVLSSVIETIVIVEQFITMSIAAWTVSRIATTSAVSVELKSSV